MTFDLIQLFQAIDQGFKCASGMKFNDITWYVVVGVIRHDRAGGERN